MNSKLFSFLFVFLVLANQAFAAVSVSLNDDSSATNDLVCSFSGEGYEREWVLNGMVQDQFKNQERIDSSNLMKNDVWTCNVYSFLIGRYVFERVFEGSDTAVVLNSAPIITSAPGLTATIGSSYNYRVTAYDADEDSLTYTLVLGPAGMSMNSNGLVIWTPTATGDFPVVVSVSDGSAVDTQSFTIDVQSGVGGLTVTAVATPASGERPLTVTFSATVVGGVAPYSYEWDFENDGTIDSFAASPVHTYNTNGTYTSRVRVTDSSVPASFGEDTVTVYVSEPGTIPTLTVSATATPNSGVRPLTVSFTSTPSGGIGGYTYLWDFGDLTESSLQNPSHTYNTAGIYTANVTVWSGTQVATSNQMIIVVNNDATGTVTITTLSCPNGRVNVSYTCDINANGPGTITYYFVSHPVNMTINSTTGVISWLPTSTGTYSFTVGATNGTISATRAYTIQITSTLHDEDEDDEINSDDLFIEAIDFESDVVQQGTELVGYITLENTGDLDMEDITVEMSIDDLDVSEKTAKFDLNNGKKETKELSLWLPSKVTEGYYTVRFVVENDDIRVTKYVDIYIKGTKAVSNVVDTSLNNFVVQSNIQSYVPPAGKARVNWLGIWTMVILFILLLVLVIYLARKATKKEENVKIRALDNELI